MGASLMPQKFYSDDEVTVQKPSNIYEDADVVPESAPSQIIQEMPEDVSFMHRFVAKNFSNSPEATVKYLQERYPQYEIAQGDGNILFKKPGESEQRVLDPSGITGFGEGVMDVTDIGTDVGAGTASTMASAAAGLGAAAGSGGVLAIPAAMAAGGGASSAMEAARQKIGQYLGIPQEVSGKDVAISGAAGALSPLFFGTGATTSAIAKKALEKGLTKTSAEELAKTQAGALSRGALNTASFLSGIPKQTISNAYRNLPIIKQLEGPGAGDLVEDVQQRTAKAVRTAKQGIGQALEETIDSAGEKVNIAEVKYVLKKHLADLEKSPVQNPAIRDEINTVKENIKNIFTQETPAIEAVAPSKILDVTGAPQFAGAPAVPATSKAIPNQISASSAFKLQEQLKDLGELTKATGGMVARNENKPRSVKALEAKARDAYSLLNEELERVTSKVGDKLGSSKELKDQYKDYSNIQRTLGKYFKTPETTYNALRNMGKEDKRMLLNTIQKVDQRLGTTIQQDVGLLDSYLTFGKVPMGPVPVMERFTKPVKGAAVGGLLGGLAAGQAGGGPGSVGAGFAAGGLAGGALSSPTAIRLYLDALRKSEAGRTGMQRGVMPLWNVIQSREEQNE